MEFTNFNLTLHDRLLLAIQGLLMEYLRINTEIIKFLTINQVCYLIIVILVLLELKKHLTKPKINTGYCVI